MMAKMFYTLEETKSALGKSEDEIKQFARDGRLVASAAQEGWVRLRKDP